MPDLPQLTVQELRGLNRAGNPAFTGVYVLRKVAQRTAKNDNTFLSIELGGHLLGERDGQAEAAGGGDGQRGAAHEGIGAGRGGEKGLLQVDDEQEGAGERRFVGHGLLQ